MPKPTTKTRQELRSCFLNNAIPTESDFAALIAAGLNQADDGILKLPDQPLGLVRQRPSVSASSLSTASASDAVGVLNFFGGPEDQNPSWQLQLIGSEKPGLAISKQAAPPMLFLDGTAGKVGIGTSNPQGTLTISEPRGTAASASMGSLLLDHDDSGGASSIVFRSKVDRRSDHAFIEYRDANPAIAEPQAGLLTIGIQNGANDHLALIPSGNVGIGTNSPTSKLHVDGAIKCTWIESTKTYKASQFSRGKTSTSSRDFSVVPGMQKSFELEYPSMVMVIAKLSSTTAAGERPVVGFRLMLNGEKIDSSYHDCSYSRRDAILLALKGLGKGVYNVSVDWNVQGLNAVAEMCDYDTQRSLSILQLL